MRAWLLLLGLIFPAIPPQQTGTLKVIVQNDRSVPVPYVAVKLTGPAVGPSGAVTSTDGDGVAEFKIIEGRLYTAEAMHDGLRYTAGIPMAGSSSTIVIPIGGVLTGRVRTSAGEPASGGNVWAGLAGFDEGGLVIREWLSTKTGADGVYRFPITTTGEYFLSSGSSTTKSLANTYYPGTHDISLAQLVLARAGTYKGGIDFNLLDSQTYRVSGRLAFPYNAAPFFGAFPGETKLVITSVNSGIRGVEVIGSNAKIADDGTFSFDGVPPGRWQVLAEIPRADLLTTSGRRSPFDYLQTPFSYLANPEAVFYVAVGREQIFVPDRDIDGVVLRVSPSDVRGRVTGLPEGVQAERIRLLPKGYTPSGSLAARVDKGEFVLRGVPPGRYGLEVSLPPEYHVARIRVGASLIHESDGTFEVANGEVAAIEITGERGTGQVDGTLRSLTPGRDMDVTAGSRAILAPALPREGNLSLYRTTTIAAVSGTFTFTDVPPGEYRIFAFARPPAQIPEVLARYATFSTPVIVREGSKVRVDPYLITDVQ